MVVGGLENSRLLPRFPAFMGIGGSAARPGARARRSGAARVWAVEEHAYGGRLLPDHAPAEATIRAGVARVSEAMP